MILQKQQPQLLRPAAPLGLRMTMAGIPIIGLLIAVLVFRKKFILTEEKVQEITEQIKGKENYR